MSIDITAFLDDFRAEAVDHLHDLDALLLALERDPADTSRIREMFLAAHTIKGGAAMLGLSDVHEVAHAMEDVLSRLRDENRALDSGTADLMFAALDRLRDLVGVAVPGSATPDPERASLVAALRARATAAVPDAAGPGVTPPAAPPSSVQPPSILLVEDSPTVRKLATMQLTDAGYRVGAAADGAEALVRTLEGRYDLIIASVETRGLRGLDLAAALRGSKTRRHVPIILMSSAEQPEDRRRATELGVEAYVRKGSFDGDELAATIRQLVGPRPAMLAGAGD